MDIRVLDSVKKQRWICDTRATLAECEHISLSKDDAKHLLARFQETVQNHNPTKAANLLAAGLFLAPKAIVNNLRRKAILRPSNHDYRSDCIVRVLTQVLPLLTEMSASPAATSYLTSILRLYEVAEHIRTMQDALIDLLRQESHPLLKCILAQVELSFMYALYRECDREDRSRDPSDFFFWTKEELAEGLSYLIHLFEKHISTFEPFWPVHETRQARANARLSLQIACHICAFRGWETAIDCFEYRLVRTGNREYDLLPPSDNFEKSLRLGFIQRTWAHQATHRRAAEWDMPSLKTLAQSTCQDGLCKAVVKSAPIARIAFEWPAAILTSPGLLASKKYFSEEREILEHLMEDWLIDLAAILDYRLMQNVQVRDLLQVQRISRYLTLCMAHHIIPRLEANPDDELAFQSVILTGTMDQIRELLGASIPEERFCHILDFLTWQPKSGTFFDAQYQPFFRWKDLVAAPLALFGHSNVVRNSIKISDSRTIPTAEEDTFPKYIDTALSAATDAHACEIPIKLNGIEAEIDNIARMEDSLFILEVKAPIEPTSWQELRTSFDHIQKARCQLDRLLQLYSDTSFRAALERKLRFPLDGITRVRTAIVVANRMFAGLRAGEHSVIGAFDLVGFLRHGKISIGDEVKRLWKQERITANDMAAFLNGQLTYEPGKKSMIAFTHKFELGEASVAVRTFGLDMEKFAQELGMPKAAIDIREERADRRQD